MLMLSFETSSKAASVALCEAGALKAQYFQSGGLPVCRTILSMANELLKNTGVKIGDIDIFAVSRGPGSFTGVRIGVSAVKGLCWGCGKPAVGVSTLEAAAYNGVFAPDGTVICAITDARRGRFCNALFKLEGKTPVRLCPDREISPDCLSEEINLFEKGVLAVGDGAELFNFMTKNRNIITAPENAVCQNAFGVAMAAADKKPGPASELVPLYLRPSQAERELAERTLPIPQQGG